MPLDVDSPCIVNAATEAEKPSRPDPGQRDGSGRDVAFFIGVVDANDSEVLAPESGIDSVAKRLLTSSSTRI
jgi:hypothetical protein